MTHTELCKLTAERFVQNKTMALYEVSMMALKEKPDVLVFNSSSNVDLYEIKMSRSDFLADFKKYGRLHPMFGEKRYYVCYGDFIKKEEIPEGWGLYYYKNNKFYKQKESSKFFNTDLEQKKHFRYLSEVLINHIICEKTNIVFSQRVLENREKFKK